MLGGIVDKIKSGVSSAANSISKAASGAAKTVSQAASSVSKAASGAASSVSKAAKTVTGSKHLGQVSNYLKGASNTATKVLGKDVSHLSQGLTQFIAPLKVLGGASAGLSSNNPALAVGNVLKYGSKSNLLNSGILSKLGKYAGPVGALTAFGAAMMDKNSDTRSKLSPLSGVFDQLGTSGRYLSNMAFKNVNNAVGMIKAGVLSGDPAALSMTSKLGDLNKLAGVGKTLAAGGKLLGAVAAPISFVCAGIGFYNAEDAKKKGDMAKAQNESLNGLGDMMMGVGTVVGIGASETGVGLLVGGAIAGVGFLIRYRNEIPGEVKQAVLGPHANAKDIIEMSHTDTSHPYNGGNTEWQQTLAGHPNNVNILNVNGTRDTV